jgi:ribosomal protein S8E
LRYKPKYKTRKKKVFYKEPAPPKIIATPKNVDKKIVEGLNLKRKSQSKDQSSVDHENEKHDNKVKANKSKLNSLEIEGEGDN